MHYYFACGSKPVSLDPLGRPVNVLAGALFRRPSLLPVFVGRGPCDYIVHVSCRPFISYAKEDREYAERIYRDLKDIGAEPWLDVHDLRGGEDWRAAIRLALRESTHVLTLISERSVSKTGFVQNEVRQALELLDNVPPNKVFVLPVRLDASTPRHERLAELHWIDMFPDYTMGMRMIARSLDLLPEPPAKRSSYTVGLTAGALATAMMFTLLMVFPLRRSPQPQVFTENRLLLPDGHRGSSAAVPMELPRDAKDLLLVPTLVSDRRFPAYRLDMLNLNIEPSRIIWSQSNVRIRTDNTFAIAVPAAYLNAGKYQLVVYGVDGARSQRLASYTLISRLAK